METRVTNLEARMSKLEGAVEELRDGIVGSMDKPGISEMMRNTVVTLNDVKSSVDQLKTDRWILRGIAAAVGVGGSVVGWLITFVSNK